MRPHGDSLGFRSPGVIVGAEWTAGWAAAGTGDGSDQRRPSAARTTSSSWRRSRQSPAWPCTGIRAERQAAGEQAPADETAAIHSSQEARQTPRETMTNPARHAAAAFLATAAACVPSQSAMFGPVQSEANRRIGLDVAWHASPTDARVPAAVLALLERPLDRDAAVRIAIANNRRLQASYDELGLAAADVADATVLRPLEVDLNRKYTVSGPGSETEIEATQDILDLLQLAQRRSIASSAVRAARARAVSATVELVASVEAGYYGMVAAEQERELRQTAFDAASASAEVVERQHAAGSATDLALARERDLREQARLDLARAELLTETRREEMNQLLGLYGESTRWSIAGRLPDLPARPPALDSLERDAVASSLELAALRAEAESASGEVSLARVRTILPELGVGVAAARRDDGEWEAGPAISIGLPLFNWQQGPRARAHARLRRAQNLLAATGIELRAQARAARQRALEAHAEARHLQSVVLPLRQRVVDETLLQYNAMNASLFELLAARRDLVDAGRQYIDALRRYWETAARVAALQRGAMIGSPREADDRPSGTSQSDREH
jgi:cobalt-zinc-cadmium efflux system outer membrane protein